MAMYRFGLSQPGHFDESVQQIEQAGGKLLRRGEHAPGVPYAYFADPDRLRDRDRQLVMCAAPHST
jgi:hypothetical protein